MDYLVLIRILLCIASLCCLGTGIAAFRRYSAMHNERLFTAGAAMTTAAIGIAFGTLDTFPSLTPLGFEWGWYVATFCGYLLLFLSSIMKSVGQFLTLKRWSIIIGAGVVIVIALSPILPDISNNQNVIVLLNILRVAVCSLGLLRYLMLYTSKGMRFSLLLCLAFLFLAVGYATIIIQALSSVSSVNSISLVDSSILVAGDIFLFVAFVAG